MSWKFYLFLLKVLSGNHLDKIYYYEYLSDEKTVYVRHRQIQDDPYETIPEFYEKVIYKIAKAAQVEILNVASHKFEPQGFTLVALLSESHFSFHTFPERGVISFDFFTCGKVNPKVALKILRNEIEHKSHLS